ncbi:hypothetical protein [Nannocystis pusilla]|uniref:hypothetical protein n=1 Tax=Nannocystis pusilla TaxID=889268 RepID=UPI003B7FB387
MRGHGRAQLATVAPDEGGMHDARARPTTARSRPTRAAYTTLVHGHRRAQRADEGGVHDARRRPPPRAAGR